MARNVISDEESSHVMFGIRVAACLADASAVLNRNHNLAVLGAVPQRHLQECMPPGNSRHTADLNSLMFTCTILSTSKLLLLFLPRMFPLFDEQ
jgi:hypothetical protein